MDEQPELILLWGSRLWRVLRILLIVLALWIAHAIYPVINISLPFRGQVVDADTGKPIEGALVLATWFFSGLAEGEPLKILAIEEAVTDPEGRFRMAGWIRLNFEPGRLDDDQPEMWHFARGYMPLHEYNRKYSLGNTSDLFQRVPRPIARELRRVGADEWGKYASEMELIAFGAFLSPGCDWVATPNTTRMMAEVKGDLNEHHPSISFSGCRTQRGADPFSTTEAH